MDFETQEITIWGKDGNSPIVPGDDDTTTKDKIDLGEIVGLAVGGLLILMLAIAVCCYCCCCKRDKKQKEEHYAAINEDDAVINHEDE